MTKLEAASDRSDGPQIIILRRFYKPGKNGPVKTGAAAYIIGVRDSIEQLESETEEDFSLRLSALQHLGRHPDDCTVAEIQDAILEVKNNRQLV